MSTSFDHYLSLRPTIAELDEHIDIGKEWFQLGTLLKIEPELLIQIEEEPGHANDKEKTRAMFQLWLRKSPSVSRKEVLECLRKRLMEKNDVAENYESYLKESHYSRIENLTMLNETSHSIFQSHYVALKEMLTDPIKASQVLFSRRIIEEATLDHMESVSDEMTLDDKKNTLLATIQEIVSNNYKKLKEFGEFLVSQRKELKDIGEKLLTEYDQHISAKAKDLLLQDEADDDNERITSGGASDILRNNYESISISIKTPVTLANLLKPGGFPISEESLRLVELQRSSIAVSVGVLLKEIRVAIHWSPKHLELFVTALGKFEETAHIADTIFKEYIKIYPEGSTMQELQEDSPVETECHSESTTLSLRGEIYVPQVINEKFSSIRCKFGATFFKVRQELVRKQLDPEEVKMLLCDCLPVYKSQFSSKELKDLFDVLELVKEKCSLIDVHCLRTVVVIFQVKEAEVHLNAYLKEIDEFCKDITVELCLKQRFEVVRHPLALQHEKIIFIIDWEPQSCTLDDIREILAKCIKDSNNIQIPIVIRSIEKGQSIAVNCYVPLSLAGHVVANVLQNVKHVRAKGLYRLVWGNSTIWDKYTAISDEHLETHVMKEMIKEKSKAEKSAKAGKVEWFETGIQLTTPLEWQCENAMAQLSQDQFEIYLFWSISEIAKLIISSLQAKKDVKKLGIYRTPVSNECASVLASTLASNKIQSLHDLTLFLNDLTKEAIITLFQSLQENSTLTHFLIRCDKTIFIDTNEIAEIIEKNTTLTNVYLYGIILSENTIPLLIDSVAKSKTLKILTLDNDNKQTVTSFYNYENVKDRMGFSL